MLIDIIHKIMTSKICITKCIQLTFLKYNGSHKLKLLYLCWLSLMVEVKQCV